MPSGGDNYSIPGRFWTEFSSNFRRNSIRFRKSWQILYRVLFEPHVLWGCSNTSMAHSRHSLLSNDFRYINVLILQGCTPDRCLCRVFGSFVFRPFCFSGMWIIFDPLDICQFWSRNYNILYVNMLHAGMERGAPAKTPFYSYLLAFF